MIAHLFEYRTVLGHEAELRGFLRNGPLRAPLPNGAEALFAARRLSKLGRENVAVTVFRDVTTCDRCTDATGLPNYLDQVLPLLGDRAISRYRVLASSGLGHLGARVLRLYRTSIATAAVEQWEQRALGSASRLAEMRGLTTIVAGVQVDSEDAVGQGAETCVVVITTWTEWDLLLAATGGRLNRALLDTELGDLEAPANADHYEIVEAEPGPG